MTQRPVVGKSGQLFLLEAPAQNSLRSDAILMTPKHEDVVGARRPTVAGKPMSIGGCEAAPDQRRDNRVSTSDNVIVRMLAADAGQSPFADDMEPDDRALNVGIQLQEFA